MTRLTLDTNCLINLENQTCQHVSVRALIDAHRKGLLVVCIPAIAASENQPGGTRIADHGDFMSWLATLDADGLEETLPMAYWDVAFWDHALWAGEESVESERAIHEALHPEIPFEYATYCTQHGLELDARPIAKRWLNAKCDVQAMWSHINAHNHVFVTEDGRFHSPARKSALVALGAGDILTPEDAARKFLASQ